MTSSHPYSELTQERVMDATESLGYLCDARVFPLNSYENRVYQIGIEDEQPLIGKFYRPARWSREQIQEEHDFLLELQADELPVVAPIVKDGQSLFLDDPFYFALFPRRGGQAPELANDDDLDLIGRWLGRLHQTGSRKQFAHRPQIQGSDDLIKASEQVLSSGLMPEDYRHNYRTISDALIKLCENLYRPQAINTLRIHGDLHTGNLLLRDDILYMVDFDDCLQGPAMQDIWMLLSGTEQEQRQQLLVIKEGYEMFRPFPTQELALIETLRTIRVMKYAAWLCNRWSDPAFPQAFPWFTGHRFWSEHVNALQEQLAALQEAPIELPIF
ncbi:MAG: serine/threonine protein kinase [Oceanospirillaceae bacterium]|nr:serine/threonine protein kinase [Oceanospirillaceae bacterium]